jgi:hypothetical protein
MTALRGDLWTHGPTLGLGLMLLGLVFYIPSASTAGAQTSSALSIIEASAFSGGDRRGASLGRFRLLVTLAVTTCLGAVGLLGAAILTGGRAVQRGEADGAKCDSCADVPMRPCP